MVIVYMKVCLIKICFWDRLKENYVYSYFITYRVPPESLRMISSKHYIKI